MWQTGRLQADAQGEIRRATGLGRAMLARTVAAATDMAEGSLAPRGVVLHVLPAEYPYLLATQTICLALALGSTAILKPSRQAPLVAEALSEAFALAGLPEGVYQPLNVNRETALLLARDNRIAAIVHAGGPGGARAFAKAAADTGTALVALPNGLDTAYVRDGADVQAAAAALVHAAFRGAGQGLGAVKRILLDPAVETAFLVAFQAEAAGLILGDPRQGETTLGPMIRAEGADITREMVVDAFERGAKPLIDPRGFRRDRVGSGYCAPQAMLGVTLSMRMLRDRPPGPLVGIATVTSEAEAMSYLTDATGLALFGADEALAQRLMRGCRKLERLTRDRAPLPDPADPDRLLVALSRRVRGLPDGVREGLPG
jgi:acyl-CoA reductase-like NAD-dependent aldehyde dehydrogenase